MLRRIIRRAVRHAYLLGAEQTRHAGAGRRDRRRHGRRVPGDRAAAASWCAASSAARRSASGRRSHAGSTCSTACSSAATSPATTRSSCTTRSGSRSTSRARSRRSAGARSTSTASDAAHGGAAHARQGGAQGRGRQGRRRAGRAVPRARSTSSGPPTSPAGRSTRPSGRKVRGAGRWPASGWPQADAGTAVDVVLDRTPFYAESGGQVGDTGRDRDADRRAGCASTTRSTACRAWCCTAAWSRRAPSPRATRRWRAIDGPRRDAIRRNHTATHVLHWALREVLGPHVKQAGSLVAPDRLRFDFSHHEAVTPRRSSTASRRSRTREIIGDAPCATTRPPRTHAESARRDRVLRRQVRRPRARARGRRALHRAVRRHARARARLHRPDQDRERGVDRRQPAPHRGGHRRGRARPHPRRRGAAARPGRHARASRRPSSPIGSSGCSSR